MDIRSWSLALGAVAALVGAACVPEVDYLGKNCRQTEDCGGDLVCDPADGKCKSPGELGDASVVAPKDAGAAVDAGSRDAGGGKEDAGCAAGAKNCNGSTPYLCVDGAWQPQNTCTGATPVCAAGACVECVAESKRCSSDKQPQTCDSTSKWKDDVPCGGATPVCNSGTCSGIRLHGGIGTLGTYATPAGGVRLRWGGFELAARTCSGNVCVKGGIAP